MAWRSRSVGYSGASTSSRRKRGFFLRKNERDPNRSMASSRVSSMKRIRILIADDHGIVRKGLRLQLEQHSDFDVVGEASDGREAVGMSDELSPDIIIMDIAMP